MRETLENAIARAMRLSAKDFAEFGQTKTNRLDWLNQCVEVRDTIEFDELELLLYLRKCRNGDLHRFLMAAKRNYEALQAVVELFPPKTGK